MSQRQEESKKWAIGMKLGFCGVGITLIALVIVICVVLKPYVFPKSNTNKSCPANAKKNIDDPFKCPSSDPEEAKRAKPGPKGSHLQRGRRKDANSDNEDDSSKNAKDKKKIENDEAKKKSKEMEEQMERERLQRLEKQKKIAEEEERLKLKEAESEKEGQRLKKSKQDERKRQAQKKRQKQAEKEKGDADLLAVLLGAADKQEELKEEQEERQRQIEEEKRVAEKKEKADSLKAASPKKTRLICISDTHNGHNALTEKLKKIHDPSKFNDILIHAGDMTNGDKTLGDFEKINKWFGDLPFDKDHIIVIAGNMDASLNLLDAKTKKELFSNAHYLEDESYAIDGINFYGTPYTPKHAGVFQLDGENEQIAEWKKIPKDVNVLIVHGPPKGILDETSGGKSVGDAIMAKEIAKRDKLKVVVFGHVHAAYGKEEKKNIRYVNAAQYNGIYEPKNPHVKPIIIEY